MHPLSHLVLTALLLIPAVLSYTGDITYYSPGLGSCGRQNTDADAVVALSVPMMKNSANPNTNPKCGATVTIFNPTTGRTHRVTVVNTCQVYAMHDLDLSLSLFRKVAPRGDGRVHGIRWVRERMGRVRERLGRVRE